MAAQTEFFATCPRGVGDILAGELLSFGAEKVKESAAGVVFYGTVETAYRACLWSRVASRVLLPLAEFPVFSEEDLYSGIRGIPWEEHFSPDSTFAVKTAGKAGTVDHTHFASLRTKDAVVDRFRDLFGKRPSVQTRDPDIRLTVYLSRDKGIASLDLSGEALHRRGYRLDKGKAPLKENLAAAVLIRAGWQELSREGRPFTDPMCGSGTLPIEAAFMAADMAPGILRTTFGFTGWGKHQSGIWTSLQVEARYRMKEGIERLPLILGYDSDRAAVRAALGNLRRAGLEKRVHIERRDLVSVASPAGPDVPRGLVVCNPPYGERMGSGEDLRELYSGLGRCLRERFAGWRAAVFTGNPQFGRAMGLRAFKVNNLYNGKIKSCLLHFDLTEGSSAAHGEGGSAGDTPGAEKASAMFSNRLQKKLKNLGKWAASEGISCYRIYDADIPEFNLAVDLYGSHAHVQEYEAPPGVDAGLAAARVVAARNRIMEVLGIPDEKVHLQVRRRRQAGSRCRKVSGTGGFFEVEEGGLRFLVNLTDFADSGLFPGQRTTRGLIREMASSGRFLNLFCSAGAATVYAAAGGASSTTSVDPSGLRLDWARRNMGLNSFTGSAHRFVGADILGWIREDEGGYGLIFLDPPAYFRSKGMEEDFDVQKDHAGLIRDTARLLAPGGTLLFSTGRRKFRLDDKALEGLEIEEITLRTTPRDFEKSRLVHRVFRIGKKCPARGSRGQGPPA